MGRGNVLIVLDTHAWLWWLDEPEKLSDRAREAIETAGEVGVPTVSCWELATLVRGERIRLDRHVAKWVAQALAHERVRPLTLTPEVAVAAGSLDRSFPGDPADRMIYATALERDAPLVTRDRRLRNLDPERTLW